MDHSHVQAQQTTQLLILEGYCFCVICGYTDLRKSVDGLYDIADLQYGVSPMEKKAFLFCGRRCDRVKIFYYQNGNYHLHYIRSSETRYQWPRKDKEIWVLSYEQIERLLSGERILREQASTTISSRI